MARYLVRRLGFALLLIFIVLSAALLLTRLAPGDFVTAEATKLSESERAKLRESLGLDRPLVVQYVDWLAGAVRFDFGQSLMYSRPVSSLLGERAINTAVLATAALLLATLIGIPLGVFSGSRRDGAAAHLIRVLSVVGLSVPPLVGSLALVLFAARTGWLPVGGMTSVGGAELTGFAWLADIAKHLPIPALALAIPMAATLERLQAQEIRTAMREVFVNASRARGATEARAVLAHAWPVALRPVLGLYGVMIGSLFSGSFIVEVVTGWPGLGRLMFDALRSRDLFLVAGCAASGALFLAAGTFIADALLALADPRVREQAQS
jgi:peptide/nickel transport system permease protein